MLEIFCFRKKQCNLAWHSKPTHPLIFLQQFYMLAYRWFQTVFNSFTLILKYKSFIWKLENSCRTAIIGNVRFTLLRTYKVLKLVLGNSNKIILFYWSCCAVFFTISNSYYTRIGSQIYVKQETKENYSV